MNKKGFTIIELLASFTLTMIIVVLLFEIVIQVKDVYLDNAYRTKVMAQNALVATKIHDELSDFGVAYTDCHNGFAGFYNLAGEKYEISYDGSRITFKKYEANQYDTPNVVEAIEMPDGSNISKWSDGKGYLFIDNSKENAYIKIGYEVEIDGMKKPVVFNYVFTYHNTGDLAPGCSQELEEEQLDYP